MADEQSGGPQTAKFDPKYLWTAVIAMPLQRLIDSDPAAQQHIVIDLNLECRGGRAAAREKVNELLRELGARFTKEEVSPQYVFASMPGEKVRELVRLDQSHPMAETDVRDDSQVKPSIRPEQPKEEFVKIVRAGRGGLRVGREEYAIYRIWPDFEVRANVVKSISTIKADAAQKSFSAFGAGVVWAVMDSGIDGNHAHFKAARNLEVRSPVAHRDFVGGDPAPEHALIDPFGHGTHVAGIIAGHLSTSSDAVVATVTEQLSENATVDESVNVEPERHRAFESLPAISGIAPECKIVSLRVLDENGSGRVSQLIAAITYVQEINGYGRRLLIHGVNMSLGYDFFPEWFACGQSPLCVEVDRLVRSGVVVVVSAGNSGYTLKQGMNNSVFAAGEQMTINDPGNASYAITVGSTHRDMPHMYGVSYFSSKGPTGDGRLKPDILAPGEKILSCAAGRNVPSTEELNEFNEAAKRVHGTNNTHWYVQESGTSMSAPHVSGAIAAFLSIRREFIGRPDEVKRIFMNAATDLGRERYFQGSGLVDLMRAIQSV